MSAHARLRETVDQAVRDILELDAQVSAGEIPEVVAAPLRTQYRRRAARALAAIADAADPGGTEETASPRAGGRPWGWAVAYALAGVTALVAALVLLPAALVDRPPGGFVTGNVPAAGDNPPTVSDAQLEQAVAENPEVVGMRLALAQRYADQGDDAAAMRHYLEAVRREPGNAEAHAHLGWLLFQVGQPRAALEAVQRGLALDPTLVDALWFQANIELHGLDDPAAALATAQQLAARNPPPAVREQVDELIAAARQRQAGTP